MAGKKTSSHQKYVIERINRSQIKNAAYNPRVIDDGAKERLLEALDTHGLVEPLVWNKKTGNLVGGHQRLEALDSLEGNKDYNLDVSVIAVDEREEAILNVQLNNPSMQGDWDTDKLADLTLGFGLSLTEDLGFDEFDIDFLFDGDDRFSELFDTPEVEEEKKKLEEIKEKRNLGAEVMAKKDNANFYCMVVFRDEDERNDFFRCISVPASEEIITVDQIKRFNPKKELI